MATETNCLSKWLWSPGYTYLFILYWHPIIRERAVKNLRDSLEERVDLEG